MSQEKKPDLVVFDPESGRYDSAFKPYPTSVSAPKITTNDLTSWKNNFVKSFNQNTQVRFEALKEEYEKLVQEVHQNNLILEAEFNFEPNIGTTYHLYARNDKKPFLSIIDPESCQFEHMGSFVLNHQRIWHKQIEHE